MDWPPFVAALASFTKALAWPIVTVVGLYWYRPTVSRLLDRIVKGKIGPSGAEVEALAPNQSAVESPAIEVKSQAVEASGIKGLPPHDLFFDTFIEPTVSALETDFPENPAAQNKWLARLLSIANVSRIHEETHRMIFGSQLMLLYRINSVGGVLAISQAHLLYQQAADNFAELYKSFDFQAWMKFLIVRQLVQEATIANGPGVSLTHMGKLYLQYVVDRSLPEKPIG